MAYHVAPSQSRARTVHTNAHDHVDEDLVQVRKPHSEGGDEPRGPSKAQKYRRHGGSRQQEARVHAVESSREHEVRVQDHERYTNDDDVHVAS